MPKAPDWIDKVNAVIDFVDNPCNAPWSIYFELALEPAGTAAITLLTFGLDDVIRGFARPKGLRSGRHGRRGRRSGKRGRLGFAIPEIGEMIGERLPGAEEAKARKVSQGVKNLWLVDGVIQRLLWYWLVVDVTTDFFYDWTSLIMESEFCKKSAKKRILRTGTIGGASAIQDWEALQADIVEYNVGSIPSSASSFVLPSGNWIVSSGLTATNTFVSAQTHEIGVFANNDPNQPIQTSGTVLVQPGEAGEMVVSADVKGPLNISIFQRINVGFAMNDQVMHYVQEA